jgi:transcription initiation factor TFIIA large subunit
MTNAATTELYRSVVNDVVNSVRDMFLDDGVEPEVLLRLKEVRMRR